MTVENLAVLKVAHWVEHSAASMAALWVANWADPVVGQKADMSADLKAGPTAVSRAVHLAALTAGY